jgi:hypothetical protein
MTSTKHLQATAVKLPHHQPQARHDRQGGRAVELPVPTAIPTTGLAQGGPSTTIVTSAISHELHSIIPTRHYPPAINLLHIGWSIHITPLLPPLNTLQVLMQPTGDVPHELTVTYTVEGAAVPEKVITNIGLTMHRHANL